MTNDHFGAETGQSVFKFGRAEADLVLIIHT